MVAGRPDGGAHAGGDVRFELPGPASGQPLHVEAELALELVELLRPRPGRRRRPPPPASPRCGSRWADPTLGGELGGEARASGAPTPGSRARRGSSPWWTSLTGASIPAAAHDAPRPGSGSTTATVMPRLAASQAVVRPMTPPPDDDDVGSDDAGGTVVASAGGPGGLDAASAPSGRTRPSGSPVPVRR